MPLGLKSAVERITIPAEISPGSEAEEVTVVTVPVPKGYYAVVWGQRTAGWLQRYNTYLLDENKSVIITGGVSVLWDAPSSNSEQFKVTSADPQSVAPLDPKVFFFGPYDKLRYVAVACYHSNDGGKNYKESTPRHQTHDFTIDTSASNKDKDALTVTMVHAEDGGDSDYHDTIVGVSVTSTKV